METCTLQIDSELYGRYCEICEKLGTEPKEAAERFFRWCANHPRELQKWGKTPETGILPKGQRTHRVYVAATAKEKD